MKTIQTLTGTRDADFYRVCCRELAESASAGHPHATLRRLIEAAISRPAPQFYISYPYALRKLCRPAGTVSPAHPLKQLMWTDFEAKVKALAGRRSLSLEEAIVRTLTDSAAPRFYISPSLGERIFNRMRRRRRRHTQ